MEFRARIIEKESKEARKKEVCVAFCWIKKYYVDSATEASEARIACEACVWVLIDRATAGLTWKEAVESMSLGGEFVMLHKEE